MSQEKIRAVLERFTLGWRKADPEILKSTWDSECRDCIYIPSETESPVVGFEEIAKYYAAATTMFPITSMEISNVKILEYGDFAYGFCDISIGFKVQQSEYLVHPRATFLFRRRENQWYTIHYHESIRYEVPQS